MPWPAWSAHALAAALAACALAADGVPAGWAIAQGAVASVADAGRVLLPACLVATGKGAHLLVPGCDGMSRSENCLGWQHPFSLY